MAELSHTKTMKAEDWSVFGSELVGIWIKIHLNLDLNYEFGMPSVAGFSAMRN